MPKEVGCGIALIFLGMLTFLKIYLFSKYTEGQPENYRKVRGIAISLISILGGIYVIHRYYTHY